MMQSRSRSGETGVAIITALLIVAIATTVSVTISTNLQLDVRRTGNIIARDQAMMYALAAESWAQRILQEDRKENDTDHLGEIWAIEIPPLPVEGGYIRGRITDLHGCFDINSLVKGSEIDLLARERFENLLASLELPTTLSQGVIDWIDPDVETTIPDGAEDGYYMGLPVPYRTANAGMASRSELRLVRGFEDPAIYNRVVPNICALGERVPVNVNTASVDVLRSLSKKLSDSDIESILEYRIETPFTSVGEFTAFNGLKEKLSSTDNLAVASRYFLLETEARTGQVIVRMYSVIERDDAGKTRVLRRSESVY